MTSSTSPFGAASTALEVVEGVDLHGRRALVTGAASGIGVETARALAAAGAETIIAARDTTAAERVAADVRATTGNRAVSVAHLDLLDRGSIDRLVASVPGPLHLLVNNAGVMAVPQRRLSPEGHELQFATNHLGHFRLTLGLLPALRAAGGARVVSVSSRAHQDSPVVFDDIDFERRPYDPALAYAQSKTANVLFAVEAARRWSDDGILTNALHPGAIADSNLSRHYAPGVLDSIRQLRPLRLEDPGAGRRHQRVRGHVPTARRRGGPLLRGLPGGGGRRSGSGRPGRHRRRAARPRPRLGREAVGDLRADDVVISGHG